MNKEPNAPKNVPTLKRSTQLISFDVFNLLLGKVVGVLNKGIFGTPEKSSVFAWVAKRDDASCECQELCVKAAIGGGLKLLNYR